MHCRQYSRTITKKTKAHKTRNGKTQIADVNVKSKRWANSQQCWAIDYLLSCILLKKLFYFFNLWVWILYTTWLEHSRHLEISFFLKHNILILVVQRKIFKICTADSIPETLQRKQKLANHEHHLHTQTL